MQVNLITALRDMLHSRATLRRIENDTLDLKTLSFGNSAALGRAEEDWWFSRGNFGLNVFLRALLLFLLVESPRFIGIVMLLIRGDPYIWLQPTLSLADLILPFSFFLMDSLHHGFYKLQVWFESEVSTSDASRAPKDIIFKPPIEVYRSKRYSSINDAEKYYYKGYFREILVKTVNNGFELAFSPPYQVSAGVLGAVIGWVIFSRTAPIALSLAPEWYRPFDALFSLTAALAIWFAMGAFLWAFTIIVLTCTAIGQGCIVDFEPEVGMMSIYSPLTDLNLKSSTCFAFIIAWVVPIVFLWGAISPAGPGQQYILGVAEGILLVGLPVTLLSYVIPTWYLHLASRNSRERKVFQLQSRIDYMKKRMAIHRKPFYAVLLRQLEICANQQVWPVNTSSIVNVIGALILPFLTFLAVSGVIRHP